MRLLELRRTLGAHADSIAVLWNHVYRAIGGRLARLMALAEQFVAATLKRV